MRGAFLFGFDLKHHVNCQADYDCGKANTQGEYAEALKTDRPD
jgi:hypothetical protein